MKPVKEEKVTLSVVQPFKSHVTITSQQVMLEVVLPLTAGCFIVKLQYAAAVSCMYTFLSSLLRDEKRFSRCFFNETYTCSSNETS